MRTCASSRMKKRVFIGRVNSRCFCWFPAAILVHQNGTPIWRLHTKLYKGTWSVTANNSETVGHKDLRLGQIVYIQVLYNISFFWLLPLDGFHFIFLLCDSASQGSIELEGMGGAGQPLLPNGTFSKFIIASVAPSWRDSCPWGTFPRGKILPGLQIDIKNVSKSTATNQWVVSDLPVVDLDQYN